MKKDKMIIRQILEVIDPIGMKKEKKKSHKVKSNDKKNSKSAVTKKAKRMKYTEVESSSDKNEIAEISKKKAKRLTIKIAVREEISIEETEMVILSDEDVLTNQS